MNAAPAAGWPEPPCAVGFDASFAFVSALKRGRVRNELRRQLLVEQREQEVLRIELGMRVAARELLRGGDRLLRLDGEPREVHQCLLAGWSGR